MQELMQAFFNHAGNLQSVPPEGIGQALDTVRKYYDQCTDPGTMSFLLFKMVEQIMRSKQLPEHTQQLYEQCGFDVINRTIESEFRYGSEAIRFLLDSNMEYYKHHSLDPLHRHPLGLNRKLNYYQPQVGEEVDVVKPHITSTSYCAWTRGTLLARDGKKYTLKYANTDATVTVTSQPFFDLVGTRTQDHPWRDSLEFGSLIDAFSRYWYPATVVEVGMENGARRVRVSFRRFCEDGKKVDSDGNRYQGLGPNEDEWIDIYSYRIQRPGKMARQLCEYSYTSEQLLVDDTYDLLFEKEYEEEPFAGIMRCTYTRSLTYLGFYQHFWKRRGHEVFLQALRRRDLPIDSYINIFIMLGNTSFLVPRMAVQRHLPLVLSEGIEYMKEQHKQFNAMRLDAMAYFIDAVSKRLYSLSRKHNIMNEIKRFIVQEYLKLNLEKQMIALRFLFELIKPLRPYPPEERQQLNAFLLDNQIFYRLVYNNVHEQILSRSGEVVRYMLEQGLAGWPEVEHIWGVVPHSDLRGRATVQRLLGELSKDFPFEFTAQLLDRLLAVKETELTVEKLQLVRVLKDRPLNVDYKVKILNYLWELLTVKATIIKQQVEEQAEAVFRGFISTLKEGPLKLEVLKAILQRLRQITVVRSEMYLFKEFILTYPTKHDPNEMQEEGGAPRILREVVDFLKKEQIYEVLLRLLAGVKAKEKIESILELVHFLFDRDRDDVSSIVQAIYQQLGPTDVFLLWAKSLTSRATVFFVSLFQNPTNMQKFEKISNQAMEALKSILLDINVSVGNIRILKKRKVVLVPVGPLLPNQTSIPIPNSNATTTAAGGDDFSIKPDNKDKEESTTFIYVLKPPFECIGITFLLQLCQYLVGSGTYFDVIKLIIQFIVSLDDSIADQAAAFREDFLNKIFQHIGQVAASKQLGNSKVQLDIYVHLIQEMLAETERDGLIDARPHLSTIEGEILRLKVQNTITGNEINKKQPTLVQINENMTFWDLKVRLAEIYSQPVGKIDVIKYVNPIEDTNNGKAITDLHFFNQEAIKVCRRDPRDIPRHELVTGDNKRLSRRFQQIVEKWFCRYQEGGLLRAEGLMRLSSENWRGSMLKDQAKVEEVVNKYDLEKQGGITLGHFKDFFHRKALDNLLLVWRLLNLSGYLNNLRHKDDPPAIPPTSTRRLLSTRKVYDTIFQVLSCEGLQAVHLNFYRLLVMLETDQQLCRWVKGNIKEFLQGEKCIYKLSYGLQSLTNQLDSNLPLYAEFYQHGGHQEIANKLASFFSDAEKSVYTFDTSLKTIVIPNLLKILNSYVYPLTSEHRMVRFFKKVRVNHLDMPEVIKKLEEPDSFADPQEEKRAVLLAGGIREINIEQLYNLALRILQNLTKNFGVEYLVRLTYEIIKLFGYLSFAYSGYSPGHLFLCANSGSLNIRRSAHALVYLQLLQRPGEVFSLLQNLVKNIPLDVKYSSNTYFELIKWVLQRTLDNVPDNEQTNQFFTQISIHLFDLFFQTPNQTRQAFTASRILEGILQNLLIIVQKRPAVGRFLRHLRQKLVQDCLFFYQVRGKLQGIQVTGQMLLKETQVQHFSNYVKCKTESTRKLLMELIYLLYQQSQPCDYFFERYLLPVLVELPDNTRRTSGRFLHVGLNNLGSTCYLNSMMQVLNTIDPFRNALMRTASESPLVLQLQSLFSYLFFSERLDYVPKELLNSFQPPINPSIQQDTTQFLNFLFDRLQPRLKETPFRRLLEELFQGSQVAQMICHACGAKRERLETFFSYSVEIDGKYDLQTALDGMNAGELISDCLCESCGARSDTTKRNVLKEVPNIFFVHLKRIVFDYNLFVNTKIHSRLYFPEQLDYQPFTKQGLELRESLGVQYIKGLADNQEEAKKFAQLTLHGHNKDFYKLNLKGIIVHSGTPDVGHYYSIIKKSNGWIKFDDSRVTSFPTSFFDQECYGGTFVADQWGGSASSKNAYVLVYEKELKRDIEIEEPQQDGSLVQKILPEKQLGAPYNTIAWYKQVWLDNHSLMLEQHLTADSYSREFLTFIGKMLELTPSPSTVRIISEVFFKISALSGQVGTLLDIFLKHQNLIDADILDRYVLSDPKRTFGLLFHQQPKVRDFASSYIERVLLVNYAGDDVTVKERVARFIQEYFNALHGEVAKNWLRIDGYFKLFQKLVEGSLAHLELYMMFLQADIITCFIDFIMQRQSPINIVQKKYSLGTKSNPVSFASGLNIILFLLKRSFGFVGNNFEVPALSPSDLFHLSDNAVCCLSSMPFYEKMIKENQNPFAIASIIERLSILNLPFSMAIARVLLKVFNENTDASDDCDTVMLCITKLLNIKDAFWRLRAQAILGFGTCYVFDKNVMVTIEEEKYVYPSTLDNIFPLQSLLSYIHINRQRVPLTVLNMIKTLLEATSCSEQAMDYLIQQPAPSYVQLRYIDWLRPYVNEVLATLTGLSDKKRQDALDKVSLCNLYLDDLYRRIEKQQAQLFVMVIGEVGERVLIQSFTDPAEQVNVNIYRVHFFGVQSLPNGKSNSMFQAHLTNGRLETLASEDSNILKFFKQSCKPLAIKAKNVQQAEDKELMSLFDEDPNPPSKKEVGTEMLPEEKPLLPQVHNVVIIQPVQPLEPIEEIVPLQINIQGGRVVDDYMHVIELSSKSETNKFVELNISCSNAKLPQCLRFMLGKSKEEYYFYKHNPYDPLGKIDYQLTVNDHIENPKTFFRLYGHSYVPPPPEPVPEERPKQERTEMEPDPLEQFAVLDQIDCPVCTYLNPVANTICELCGSALNQA